MSSMTRKKNCFSRKHSKWNNPSFYFLSILPEMATCHMMALSDKVSMTYATLFSILYCDVKLPVAVEFSSSTSTSHVVRLKMTQKLHSYLL